MCPDWSSDNHKLELDILNGNRCLLPPNDISIFFPSVINCYAFIFFSVTPDLCRVAAFYEKQFVFVIRQWTICLYKSSNVLEHFMWPQRKLQCNQMLTARALIWNCICDCIYNNLNFSMHVSERMWVGERHKKSLKTFSYFFHCLSRLTDASIWLKEAWLMETN